MRPAVGSLVLPARNNTYLDPLSYSRSVTNIAWCPGELGIILVVEPEFGINVDMWLTLLVPRGIGYCLSSEVRLVD